MRTMREAFDANKVRERPFEMTYAEAYASLAFVEGGMYELRIYMKRGGKEPIFTNTMSFSGGPDDIITPTPETLTRLGHELVRSIIDVMKPAKPEEA